jgi:general secretion pathway protein L
VTEKLFIRLGSKAHDTIHWLVLGGTSADEPEIIASGELQNADQLSELTNKAEHRQIQVFVPGCDVLLKSLHVPAKSNRAMRLAVPYMLEDTLAEEVEQLFFAYAELANDSDDNNCFTAIVAHKQMQQWLSWLADAEIETKSMLPDVLAMPLNDNGWSAITLGNGTQQQVIVRQSLWKGFALDASAWQLQCQIFSHQQEADEEEAIEQQASIDIQAYSPLAHSDELAIIAMPEELPMALLAQNHSSKLNRFNLLQGQYKIKESRSHAGQQWLWVAGFAVFALLLSLGHKTVELWQLNTKQENIEQEIVASYKKAFPNTKRVRVSTIKSQLNRELALLGGVGDRQGFLAMLAKVQPAFTKVPALKPESLKFDGKRQELRIQAGAKDYQAFEQFSVALLAANFTVKQGSQSNQGEQVTGSFSISNKSVRKGNKGNKAQVGNKTPAGNKRSNKNNKETSS